MKKETCDMCYSPNFLCNPNREKLKEGEEICKYCAAVEFLRSMKVLNVKNGDVLVIKTGTRMTSTMKKVSSERIKEIFYPTKLKDVMFIEEGTDIGVLRSE